MAPKVGVEPTYYCVTGNPIAIMVLGNKNYVIRQDLNLYALPMRGITNYSTNKLKWCLRWDSNP